ncbi:MAG TPA: OmpA family protein [Candidatus Binatia bacterium]|jgi:outer membrane protein OmpA-like peptidoglycan-associated protein
MAVNLVEMVEGYLTPDIIRSAGSFLGESETGTEKAMQGIVPAQIAAFANQASTSGGAEKLTRMLDSGKYDAGMLNNLGSVFSGGDTTRKAMTDGKEILGSVLGNKTEGVVDQIARFAGIRSGSTSSLMALAAPLIMTCLGRQRATIGQSPSALASLLGGQKSFVSDLLPAGTASLLGVGSYESARARETASTIEPKRDTATYNAHRDTATYRTYDRDAAYAEPQRRTAGWLVPAIVLGGLALAGLAWLFTRPAPVREVMAPAQPSMRMADVQLPGGVNLSLPEGSATYNVQQWLASGTDTTPKRFVFDNLNFETGTANLTGNSVATVNSLVAILKAYPSTAIRIEGHTDNTGDPAANKELSLNRANAVKQMMVNAGIAPARVGAEGFGQDNPIASNDTDTGRAQNRRTELVVAKR